MTDGPPLIWAGQTALKFYGRTAVDENYNGLALDYAEGARIAGTAGDADIVFMKHHGDILHLERRLLEEGIARHYRFRHDRARFSHAREGWRPTTRGRRDPPS